MRPTRDIDILNGRMMIKTRVHDACVTAKGSELYFSIKCGGVGRNLKFRGGGEGNQL